MKEIKFYHGGVPGMEKGDIILPPSITGMSTLLQYSKQIDPDGVQRHDRVYITTSRAAADLFASSYPRGDVYKVKPIGELSEDPDCTEEGLSYQCEKAVVVAAIRRKATLASANYSL